MTARFRPLVALGVALCVAVAAPAAFAEGSSSGDGGQSGCKRPGTENPGTGESGGGGQQQPGEGQRPPRKPEQGTRGSEGSSGGESGGCSERPKPKPMKPMKPKVAMREARNAIMEELGEDGTVTVGKVRCKREGRAKFTCRAQGVLTPFEDEDPSGDGDDGADGSQPDDKGGSMEPMTADDSDDDSVESGKFKAVVKVKAVRGEDGPEIVTKLRITWMS